LTAASSFNAKGVAIHLIVQALAKRRAILEVRRSLAHPRVLERELLRVGLL
jgi:hypothetical protein